MTQVGRYEEAVVTAAQARADGERAGDRYSIGYALDTLAMVQVLHHRNVAAALEWTEQVLAAIGDGPDTADLRLTAAR